MTEENTAFTDEGIKDEFSAAACRYKPLIESMTRRFSGSSFASETAKKNGFDDDDLRQEAMIALLYAVETYKPDGGTSFGLYAKVCIRNRLISVLRKRQPDITELSEEDGLFADSADEPEERYIGEEGGKRLLELINGALTEYELKVFRLYLGGRSYREISRTVGKSEKSVGNALCRIKSKLKKLV